MNCASKHVNEWENKPVGEKSATPCVQCSYNKGTFDGSLGLCQQCQGGRHLVNSVCEECPAGKYGGFDRVPESHPYITFLLLNICKECPSGKYSDGTSLIQCFQCPVTEGEKLAQYRRKKTHSWFVQILESTVLY